VGAYSLDGHPPPLLASHKDSRTSYRFYPGRGGLQEVKLRF